VVGDAGHLDDTLMGSLRSPASVATRLFESVALTEVEERELMQGKRPMLANLHPTLADSVGPIAAIGKNGNLTGLISTSAGVARVLVNFPTDRRGESQGAQSLEAES
jgi:tRNA pseudouridine55 synthase